MCTSIRMIYIAFFLLQRINYKLYTLWIQLYLYMCKYINYGIHKINE